MNLLTYLAISPVRAYSTIHGDLGCAHNPMAGVNGELTLADHGQRAALGQRSRTVKQRSAVQVTRCIEDAASPRRMQAGALCRSSAVGSHVALEKMLIPSDIDWNNASRKDLGSIPDYGSNFVRLQ